MTQFSDSVSPREAIQDVGTSDIRVDSEGDWYYQGALIFRDDIIEYFLDHVVYTADSGFCIGKQGMMYPLDVADTPFVVARVDRVMRDRAPDGKNDAPADKPEEILVLCKHCSRTETLDLTSLKVGKDNVLYCRVRGGSLPARFSRAAYYQLAEWIEEDTEKGGFFIELDGIRHAIGLDA